VTGLTSGDGGGSRVKQEVYTHFERVHSAFIMGKNRLESVQRTRNANATFIIVKTRLFHGILALHLAAVVVQWRCKEGAQSFSGWILYSHARASRTWRYGNHFVAAEVCLRYISGRWWVELKVVPRARIV
jgi:hypothetical protein